jgi:hypothetical protein
MSAKKNINNFFKINITSSFVIFVIYVAHETKKYVVEKKETKNMNDSICKKTNFNVKKSKMLIFYERIALKLQEISKKC